MICTWINQPSHSLWKWILQHTSCHKTYHEQNYCQFSHHLHWQQGNNHSLNTYQTLARTLHSQCLLWRNQHNQRHPHMSIQLKWVPAHKGIEGNKTSDQVAKRATTHNSSHISKPPKLLTKTLPHSKSAAKQPFHKKLKNEAQLAWEKSPRYRRMQFIDPTTLSNNFINLVTPLPRKSASIITQIKTKHIPLANYLFCISKAFSPTFPSCQYDTDCVEHLILHCPAHHNARENLRYSTGGRDIDIPCLPTNDKLLKALIRFLAETRQFNRTQPPPGPNEPQQDTPGQTEEWTPLYIPFLATWTTTAHHYYTGHLHTIYTHSMILTIPCLTKKHHSTIYQPTKCQQHSAPTHKANT